jgi:hypothetical protein
VLFDGLDPLRHAAEFQLVSEVDQALYKPAHAHTVAESARERHVDLDDVHGEGIERAERGVAGAEIVERDAGAELTEGGQAGPGLSVVVIEQSRLGDLEDASAAA